ncbi:hypothetical protein [Streptomyces sp. NPDC048385]|uniref:hypothetical protein n=1 Tax=unclassified Streptomyces TaxID=2593676 RepID=UPI00343C5DD5
MGTADGTPAGIRSPGRAAITARTLRRSESPGLTGEETYTVRGLADADAEGLPPEVTVTADGPAGSVRFTARVRIDTPTEADHRHGGILPYALRTLRPS